MPLDIFRATSKDIPALKKLYEQAFHSAEEADLVFGTLPAGFCFCARQEGAPCAMAFALPADIRCRGEGIPAAYIFAVATAEEMRGLGVSTALLEHIWQALSAEGVKTLLLRPATESLAGFYAARGYRYITQLARAGASVAAPAPEARFWPVFPREYRELRARLLSGKDHIAWGGEMLEAQHRFLRLYGGEYCALGSGEDIWGCAAFYLADGALDIQELLAPPERIGEAAAAIIAQHPSDSVTVRLGREDAQRLGLSAQPFLMARWEDGDTDKIDGVYAALVMD